MNKLWSIAPLIKKIQQPGIIAYFIKKASIAFVIQVTGIGLGYLLQVFLARVMGTQEYGLFTYIFVWSTICAVICNLGIPLAVLRFIPHYITKGNWGLFQGVIRGSSKLTVTVSIMMSFVLTFAALLLNYYSYLENLVPILFGIWLVPLLALENLQCNLFRGSSKMVAAYGPSKVLRPLLFIAGTGAMLLWAGSQKLTAQLVFIITIITYVILILSQQVLIHKNLLNQGETATPIYQFRSWLRVSLPLLLIIGFIIISNQTSIVMIGALLDPVQVGIYNAATKTSYLASFVYIAVEAIAAPTIASLYTAGDQSQLQKVVTTMAHLVFWPTMLVTLFLILFSNYILRMFGSEFLAAQSSLVILAVGQLVNSATGPVGYMLDLTGHQDQSARVRCFTAITNFLLNYFLIPKFGIMGAAIATSIVVILDNLIIYFLAVKYTGVHASIFSHYTLNFINKKKS
ncbi:flippase [Nostoc sp. FACHB-110]|uniref:flippase n=1 Tax=Nostoc sp. FACHB-110 TaxID=2692834 RepID=UPI0016856CC8|nr:flippase [Nostoc sp. FACHB-110]MBD2435781.1 flippase [Nostoc sp. FACHB-110]